MVNKSASCDWQLIYQQLAETIPSAKFDAWIRPIQGICENKTLSLMVPSRFFLDGLKDRYASMIQDIVEQQYGQGIDIQFGIDRNNDMVFEQSKKKKPKEKRVDGFLDQRFTFDNFVVGSSNEFCHAACRAVADQPGTAYNPLYLYGGVGLGKTHLITAVANELLQQKDDVKISYRSGERFTNELISAIRDGSTPQFRDRYRQADILIIDDVQFIAGKLSTQEEFFHTFNALYESQKQIVLTSDRSPREINHLEERLQSRFNWGLVADIQPPNMETRQAILKRKAEIAGMRLPEDVINLLAAKITSNVRELEGALTRLTAHATLTNKKIDIDFTRHVLRDLLQEKVVVVSIEDIQKIVSGFYNLRLQDMRSTKRSRAIAYPRQIAMYISKKITSQSLPSIGEAFGGKDHTTVLHAVRKIESILADSHELQEEIEQITRQLKN